MYRNRNNKLEMSFNEIKVISRGKGKNNTTTKKQEKVDSPLIFYNTLHDLLVGPIHWNKKKKTTTLHRATYQ